MGNKLQKYRGQQISVCFDSARCIHSRNCVLGLPKVFQANAAGEWIQPDNASAEDISALVRTCPSGALSYERHDTVTQEQAPEVNVIRVLENGPLAVHADLRINGKAAGFRATLCRCGASHNKPYCDGSHRDAKFRATGEPVTIASQPLDPRDGPLEIKLLKNGPLALSGNLEICAGTGRTLTRTTETALCRCGASNNKPYCDGSHTAIGFKSD